MTPSLDFAEKVDLETTHRGYRLLTVFKTVPLPLGLLLFLISYGDRTLAN